MVANFELQKIRTFNFLKYLSFSSFSKHVLIVIHCLKTTEQYWKINEI